MKTAGSEGNTRKECSPSDQFCSQISIVEGYSGNLPMFFQGCSYDVRQIYDAPCENYGVSDVFQKGGRQNSWHAVLSCCSNNYCNSATTVSAFFATFFVILINIFVFAK
uniref:UPAR/Ly6 domain-containing protein n=1 Tax=Panagrolaimus sp. PS1159 TaxID=55785 RepID=A0AC35G6V5_9BILA